MHVVYIQTKRMCVCAHMHIHTTHTQEIKLKIEVENYLRKILSVYLYLIEYSSTRTSKDLSHTHAHVCTLTDASIWY